jgi:hypothetical protein
VPFFLRILKHSSLFEESVQVKFILLEEMATPFRFEGDLIVLDGG